MDLPRCLEKMLEVAVRVCALGLNFALCVVGFLSEFIVWLLDIESLLYFACVVIVVGRHYGTLRLFCMSDFVLISYC